MLPYMILESLSQVRGGESFCDREQDDLFQELINHCTNLCVTFVLWQVSD